MAIDKGDIDAMHNLGKYYTNIEKNYYLANKYYSLLLNYDIDKFYAIFMRYINNTIDLSRLIINNICELFINNSLSLEKTDKLARCIFSYLETERDYEKLPENINIFFVYIGKILFKKYNQSKIINSELYEKNNKVRKVIEKLIQDSICSHEFSLIIIMKFLKEMYEGYIDNKYAPEGSGYLKAKKDFEIRSDSESERIAKTKEQQNNNNKDYPSNLNLNPNKKK
jgi:hypothetical protein